MGVKWWPSCTSGLSEGSNDTTSNVPYLRVGMNNDILCVDQYSELIKLTDFPPSCKMPPTICILGIWSAHMRLFHASPSSVSIQMPLCYETPLSLPKKI